MKNLKLLFFIIILAACAGNESPNEPVTNSEAKISDYFLFGQGGTKDYLYTVVDRDNNVISSGNRTSTNLGLKNVLTNQYYSFDEKLNSSSGSKKYETHFRFSADTLKQLIDTAGTYALIPDSLKNSLVLKLNLENSLFEFPLSDGASWDVYTSDISLGSFRFNVIKFTANYLGKENVDLGSGRGIISADKINYKILLTLPDINNLFVPNIKNYSADIWFSNGLGLIKISGNKFFTNFIVGRPLNLVDTLLVETQTLQ